MVSEQWLVSSGQLAIRMHFSTADSPLFTGHWVLTTDHFLLPCFFTTSQIERNFRDARTIAANACLRSLQKPPKQELTSCSCGRRT